MNKVPLIIAITLISACSAKPMKPGAERVFVSNDKPNLSCKFLAEVSGGQGNWWTDDITSNHAAVQGSRNDLKNNAFDLGADYVHIQNTTQSESELGGTTASIIGHAYKCNE